MSRIFSLLVLCILPGLSVLSTEPPDFTLDPQGTIYGMPYGTPAEQVVAKLGEPDGSYKTSDESSMLFYGRTHAFLFEKGKLVGLRISDSVLDWRLMQALPFDGKTSLPREWRLSNGIFTGMSLGRAKEILGDGLKKQGYQHFFESGSSTVWFDVIRFSGDAPGEREQIRGLLMVKKGAEGVWQGGLPAGAAAWDKEKKVFGFSYNPTQKGVRVNSVFKDSAADKAGLVAGDLVTAAAGESLVGLDKDSLRIFLEQLDKGVFSVTDPKGKTKELEMAKARRGDFMEEDGVMRMASRISGPTEIAEGDTAPRLVMKTLDGKPFDLETMRGKTVLVNFTASWCQPCKEELPFLELAFKELPPGKFQLVSVFLDDQRPQAEEFVRERPLPWTVVRDEQGWDCDATRLWGITSVPTNVLISLEGKVLATDLRGAGIVDRVRELMEKK